MSSSLRASVVIPTFNRKAPLVRLLSTLTKQTIPREHFEVLVVDDGSAEEVAPAVQPFAQRLAITVLRQENSGVAVARQRGVTEAKAPIIVFVDDDMLLSEGLLAAHLAEHDGHPDRVVLGRLLPAEEISTMPLFERFHIEILERMNVRWSETRTFIGSELYTGNVSLPRDLFFRAGGFDPSFFLEDAELGVRLELCGAELVFCPEATSVHASDHTSVERWLERSVVEGREWVRLSRKHPDVAGASPWNLISHVGLAGRAFVGAALLLPELAPALSKALFQGSKACDRLDLEKVARGGITFVYALRYCEGMRRETGSLRDLYASYRSFARARAHPERARASFKPEPVPPVLEKTPEALRGVCAGSA